MFSAHRCITVIFLVTFTVTCIAQETKFTRLMGITFGMPFDTAINFIKKQVEIDKLRLDTSHSSRIVTIYGLAYDSLEFLFFHKKLYGITAYFLDAVTYEQMKDYGLGLNWSVKTMPLQYCLGKIIRYEFYTKKIVATLSCEERKDKKESFIFRMVHRKYAPKR